jgi:hypothetical protein
VAFSFTKGHDVVVLQRSPTGVQKLYRRRLPESTSGLVCPRLPKGSSVKKQASGKYLGVLTVLAVYFHVKKLNITDHTLLLFLSSSGKNKKIHLIQLTKCGKCVMCVMRPLPSTNIKLGAHTLASASLSWEEQVNSLDTVDAV